MVGFQVLMASTLYRMNLRSSRRRSCGARLRGSSVRLQPERIVLFGSHAKGVAQPGNDVDMLTVSCAQLSGVFSDDENYRSMSIRVAA